jgi:hypothetical protein
MVDPTEAECAAMGAITASNPANATPRKRTLVSSDTMVFAAKAITD